MNTAGRLATYGAGLAVAFVAAFATASAVVPESVVASWKQQSSPDDHGEMDGMDMAHDEAPVPGLAMAQDGYLISPVTAPAAAGRDGNLSFRILTTDGHPVTHFETTHDKDLHLIVVRTDGSRFRHVHPTLDTTTGVWSIPWRWDEAGTYRVFADFQATSDPSSAVTLTRSIDVAGPVAPSPATGPRTVDTVDGVTVTATGDLAAGRPSELRFTVTRSGTPVTTLQPYLGAFGHLIALRDGDLAYLHVHAAGVDPTPGQTSGPTIRFVAHVPTPGRYLLYLDFQVDGDVHTATFVLDAPATSDGEHT
ncbi:heavy metal-binding domain-containing protein [Williamsia sterculiae]|uniref:Heavy-metal-associated domain-containing protein n=1 Tax=Williamsia sterculiae TaxID=1344003 RepID=A0A1N7CK56_9NOCA|nr:heavy metal-binding domain-containing protein [Williamsia sterculiae]SIR64028.1 hypothetical protein SAMN05445060_0194 [Williamsia sterculiae]